ncbi:DUF2262 domain-containing protein [Bacillus infantis]|uniref:DUF2262 domain-containing protein n=1 Tax=Bacillus infantis TaxID=324767 RepID=UPI003CF62331
MIKTIRSSLIGVFHYNEELNNYEHEEGKIHWTLDCNNIEEILKIAEQVYINLGELDRNAKKAIATELIQYKNEFWPEYDENDESLVWDAVDAGEFDTKIEEFEEVITLSHINIKISVIYCEYNDGGLFGGHRIHAYFDNDFKLVKANI